MQLKLPKVDVVFNKKSVKSFFVGLLPKIQTAIKNNSSVLFSGLFSAFFFGILDEILQELVYTGIQMLLTKALALCLSVTTSTLVSSCIKIIFKKITKKELVMETIKKFFKSIWANKKSLISTIAIVGVAIAAIVFIWLQYVPKTKTVTETADIVVYADEVEPAAEEPEVEEPEVEEPEVEEPEVEAEHKHSYKKVSETAPTCTANGVQVYECDCGDTYSVVIAKLGHDIVNHEAKAATCTEEGYAEYQTCTRCDLDTKVVIPATGHTVVEDEAVDAICGRAGLTAGSHCEVCGEIIVAQEVIPATGTHVAVIDKAVAPTCEEEGLTIGSHCFVCGDVIVAQEVVPALGHNWDEGTITKEPTTEEEGVCEFVCLNCGEKKEVALDKVVVEETEEEPVEYIVAQILPIIGDNFALSGTFWTILVIILAVAAELGVTGKGFETIAAYAKRKQEEAQAKTEKSIEKEAAEAVKAEEKEAKKIEAEAQAEIEKTEDEAKAEQRKALVEQAKAKLLAEQQAKAEKKAQIQANLNK